MSDYVTVEDAENVREILAHHLGHEYSEDLAHDLFRYCTRLRCQPNTRAYFEGEGFDRRQIPAHRLVT